MNRNHTRLPKKEKKTLNSKGTKLTSCKNFRMIQPWLNVLKDQQSRELRRIRTTCPAVYLCTGQFQNRPSPPRANPRAFDFFEKFWSNSPLCCQIRRKNAPPIRASKRVKSPTLQGKKNRLPLEINRIAYLLNKFCKFSATTNFLFSLSSLHALNKDIFHDITI